MLLAIVATIVVTRLSGGEVITPPAPSRSTEPEPVTRADAASTFLLHFTHALSDGSRHEALSLAAPGDSASRQDLAMIYDNVRHLGLRDLSMRFVDEEPGKLTAEDRRTLGSHAWVADVALGWRVGGYDTKVGNMEVSLALVDTHDGVAFGSAGGDYTDSAPLWLLDHLAVVKSKRALVAVADKRQAGRYAGLADQAVRDVRAVLPRWRGRLVVEVPADEGQLDEMLQARPHAYDSIAAVTATVDGSMAPSSPVHIMVNPDVFGKLGAQGSQIVLSHEATHVATNAATANMPLWLLEGFADYVALARSDLPVSVTASQIIARVRKDGPPRTLPGSHDFDPSNKALGTSYEAAWLANKLFADTYGEKQLISFYDKVNAGTPAEKAFRDVGTTQAAFTARWRGYLRELAG